VFTYKLPFTVLHPRYKTTYFTRAKWPQQWITDAEALARKVWSSKYKPKATRVPPLQAGQGGRTIATDHVSLRLFILISLDHDSVLYF
jgi:hypothetical protein